MVQLHRIPTLPARLRCRLHEGLPKRPELLKLLPVSTLVCLVASGQFAAAAVYRCTSPDDTVLFVQFRCPAATTEEQVNPQRTSIVRIPALSPEERQAVTALEQSLAAARRDGTARRKQRRRAHAAEQIEARKQCQSARHALTDIQARKRQGYSAREARALDAAESRWDRLRKENC